MAASHPATPWPNDARTPSAKYYFAYGSNLHMKQMQRRCPESRYVGFGRLPDFRWQINERGFANVVAAKGHWVDGLVYEIGAGDEDKLDISEGVSKGAYEKRHMAVLVRLACYSLYRRPVSWLVTRGGPSGARTTATHAAQRQSRKAASAAVAAVERQMSHVLVYISLVHTTDGKPRDEYVGRINRGLRDAVSLGMEEKYVRRYIRPFVPELEPRSGAARGGGTPVSSGNNSPAGVRHGGG